MTTWCRMHEHASRILATAALGAVFLISPAGAQDYWRNEDGYRSPRLYQNNPTYRQYQGYDDDRFVTPAPVNSVNSFSSRPRPVTAQPQQSWQQHVTRVAQLELQIEALKTTRVAELEAEIAELGARLDASAGMMQEYAVYGQGRYGGACGECQSGCCEPCCPPVQTGWYAGFEFLFLKPSFDNSIAFLSSQNGQIANRTDALSHEFDYNYDLSTRLFLGYTSDCGLGFRTRYFHYDHDSNTPSVTIPAAGDAETAAIQPILGSGLSFFMDNGGATGFRATSSLKLQTWDLEATNQLTFCRSLVTVGGGLRYLQIEQRYRADAIHANGHIQESLFNSHDFEGIGPTLAADLLRPFSCCSGLAFYGNARGSVLIGESDQYFKKVDGTTGQVTETFTRNGADSTVYIAELGLGLQYTRGMYYGRLGWEGQYWVGGGGPTTTNGDFALHGLSLMLGLNY